MRKSIAFFGGALFVVMSLSIYLVVDQLSRMPSYESVIEAQVYKIRVWAEALLTKVHVRP